MIDVIFFTHNEYNPKVKCLDMGFVSLLDCMPRMIEDDEITADYAIAEAARCSYKRGTKTISDDVTLIRYLMRHNHTSPFEMIEFKFHCKMPIFVAREWVRHRTANLNELSGRYSEMPREYYIPDKSNVRKQSEVNHQGSEGFFKDYEAVDIALGINKICGDSFKKYDELLGDGLVREQSRMVLPLNTYTEWYWKIDLKNLLNFLNLRCDNHAQQEIRVYANAILELIKPIIPYTIEAWEDYSPYRGGVFLSKNEIEALKRYISSEKPPYSPDIDSKNKLEQREWKEKSKKLGF